MTVFVSEEAHIEVHRSGWVLLPSGVAITCLPLWDYKEGVFARIGQGPGATWMAANGGLRHPTSAELEELHDISLHIDPFTMPTQQQLVNAGVDMTEEAIDAFRDAHMTTLEWCLLHDSEVFSRMFAANWEDGPVANAGKHWTENGAIHGWWRADGSKIQDPWYGHGKYHTGYGSTTHAVDPTGLSASESSPHPSRGDDAPEVTGEDLRPTQPISWHDGVDLGTLTLGQRCCLWLGYQFGLGPREILGSEHEPIILSYSEHCRRGGRLLGVTADGLPIWAGGSKLELQTDDSDSPWCAALGSATLLHGLLPGDLPPHGLRVSVRELVEDARLADSLRPSSWVPEPGSLAILGRAGHNPLNGGPGHTRCMIQLDGEMYLGLGGNEDDTISCGWHPTADVLAWIAR